MVESPFSKTKKIKEVSIEGKTPSSHSEFELNKNIDEAIKRAMALHVPLGLVAKKTEQGLNDINQIVQDVEDIANKGKKLSVRIRDIIIRIAISIKKLFVCKNLRSSCCSKIVEDHHVSTHNDIIVQSPIINKRHLSRTKTLKSKSL